MFDPMSGSIAAKYSSKYTYDHEMLIKISAHVSGENLSDLTVSLVTRPRGKWRWSIHEDGIIAGEANDFELAFTPQLRQRLDLDPLMLHLLMDHIQARLTEYMLTARKYQTSLTLKERKDEKECGRELNELLPKNRELIYEAPSA